MRLKKDNYEKVVREGLAWRETVRRVPGAQELRVIVRDAAAGAMGSVTVAFSDVSR